MVTDYIDFAGSFLGSLEGWATSGDTKMGICFRISYTKPRWSIFGILQ